MKEIYHSLENVQDPTAKMQLLLQLSVEYLNNDLVRCEEVAMQLLLLGKEHEIPTAIMHHHIMMGRIKYRRGELDVSYQFCKHAEGLAIELKHEGGRAQCLESYGFIFNRQGNYEQALEMAKQSLALYKQVNAHNVAVGLAYNNIANAYNYMSKLDEAEQYYRLAIETIEQSERPQSKYLMNSNLGLIMYKKGNFKDAITHFEKSLEGYIASNNALAQSQTYSHIGYSYLYLKECAQALIHFQKGLKLVKNKQLFSEHCFILAGLGKLYMAWGGHDEANRYFKKALALRLEKGYWAEACETYFDLHQLFTLTNDVKKASKIMTDVKALSADKGLKEWQAKMDEVIV